MTRAVRIGVNVVMSRNTFRLSAVAFRTEILGSSGDFVDKWMVSARIQ